MHNEFQEILLIYKLSFVSYFLYFHIPQEKAQDHLFILSMTQQFCFIFHS
jgi:hypothetical protein